MNIAGSDLLNALRTVELKNAIIATTEKTKNNDSHH